jgi:hypothetical protein
MADPAVKFSRRRTADFLSVAPANFRNSLTEFLEYAFPRRRNSSLPIGSQHPEILEQPRYLADPAH